MFFFFKQKTAYEMRISDWSSDVCSSDLFCVEGFVRGDPLDDGGSGNTMFFDFGLRLMARQATNTRAVTLEGTPVGSTLTYNPGTDRTVPTDRFIHFAITRKSSIIRSEERRVGKACVGTCRSRW